jgi:integrase
MQRCGTGCQQHHRASVCDEEICLISATLRFSTEGRQSGEFVFATKTGKPLEPSHVQRFITKKNGVPGAHALRRYRLTWLEEQGCPRGLEAFWMGHSNGDMRGRYDKTAEDREFRRKQVERIGTGLVISEIFSGFQAPSQAAYLGNQSL